MPFVKRNELGAIVAVSHDSHSGFEEEVSSDNPDLAGFLSSVDGGASALSATDQDFVRVLEDVVQLLIDKGVILFTDLPDTAQEKIMRRQQLRSELGGRLDLIGDD